MLRETWEASEKIEESMVSYMLETQKKLTESAVIIQANLTDTQQKLKTCPVKGCAQFCLHLYTKM